ncbi:pyruvate, phosphate dikinase [Candidatus Endolissoclinum faulkneri L5]|uniref:Pyruvate, phosphate dikinase n=1 Tax=Candidatus Endolissoclinum faulkneri L5 TaxID=1401328 RepID=V9TR23_9PROT|nr:pyruvate, phosphate dikinase [Candidatus Endolissoclinum faulkneri]AHC73334.1 pyruvate, phosphate dikinase [Candidatus Endolissoclinum faulkneri L5]
MVKLVYVFGGGKADGRSYMRNLLGSKGANLAEMSIIGLPVPPGFTISTEVCTYYYEHDKIYPDELSSAIEVAIRKIEDEVGTVFGDADNPLLLSVRSGARVSMPGMMDTVLNLGLNDKTVNGLIKRTSSERFAYDSYRIFIQMYADVVMGLDRGYFEEMLDLVKEENGISIDAELSAEDMKTLVYRFKAKVKEELNKPFPEDPYEQLWGAISAVFGSWKNHRANIYRKLHSIPDNWGTAVNVQSMVFGNMGEDCATGVAFTRDPSTGENVFYGEFLVNAQGEDVVAGIRTPQSLTLAGKSKHGSDLPAMEELMPEVFQQLSDVRLTLESHYCDMQDIEFTVQQNKLYVLQTRKGKRTVQSALRIAVDMCDEGLITEREAVLRIKPQEIIQLLHPTLDPLAYRNIIAKGLPASPGAVSGKVVFSANHAEIAARKGERVIMVRIDTSPDDIHGMQFADGILTTRGGMTSHAAVVARGMGRPCVSGANNIRVDYFNNKFFVDDYEVKAGDCITIDGGLGEVMLGEVPTIQPKFSNSFVRIMEWADSARRMRIRTNAETLSDAQIARDFSAEGIGLCRTEHMFFEAERIVAMRKMIISTNETGRREALSTLLPMQRADFIQLFYAMEGLPVTIRLLDPPLHEFLPHTEEEISEVAKVVGMSVEMVQRRASELTESNPMLGHRGCRLAISYPEIPEMQARSIFEAATEVAKCGKPPFPEIMIPLAATEVEVRLIKTIINRVADEIAQESSIKVNYLVGSMIELPRAALQADKIAAEAEFFSFGTNDLTQTTYGLSRDDTSSFIHSYEEKGIIKADPFISLDQQGVGELIKIASKRARSVRPNIKLGICGEHGGDPSSISFCEEVGLDYVSCSPFRVPIARLAAAQATITREDMMNKIKD